MTEQEAIRVMRDLLGRVSDGISADLPIAEEISEILRATTEQDERALFEAWAKRQGHDVVSHLETGGKVYVSSFTRHAWAIWQARAALSQPFGTCLC
jgi:hypothetical protein